MTTRKQKTKDKDKEVDACSKESGRLIYTTTPSENKNNRQGLSSEDRLIRMLFYVHPAIPGHRRQNLCSGIPAIDCLIMDVDVATSTSLKNKQTNKVPLLKLNLRPCGTVFSISQVKSEAVTNRV